MLEAHVLAILILGVSSFIVGSIPLKLARWSHQPLLLSFFLCFGGGVLLATSVIHMLGEVRLKLPEYSELIFCGGFLFLYAIDEIIHVCVQDFHTVHHIDRVESRRTSSRKSSSSSSDGLMKHASTFQSKHRTSYGTIDKLPTRARFDSISKDFQEDSPLDERIPADYASLCDLTSYDGITEKCCRKHEKESSFHRGAWKSSQTVASKVGRDIELSSESSDTLSDDHTDHCHVEVQPPCPQSNSSLLGMLTALLVHAVLEGCSIGVQTDSSEILLVLAAVASHKLVLAFCLGLELTSAGYDGFKFVIFLTAFSVGCPIGIAVGVSLTHSSDSEIFMEAPLQALAAGSLLYVAVFEVLPRERYKWQHSTDHRLASFFQMIFVILGFTSIVLLSLFADYHHHNHETSLQVGST